MAAAARLAHLARRFFGSLSRRPPSEGDEEWASGFLLQAEHDLWQRMGVADRRHAIGVARDVAATLGEDAGRAVVAAALLHDAGKVESGLGTLERVAVTLSALVVGRERLLARGCATRWGRYLRHDELGAELLAAAGSDPLTVAWAREHHLPPSRWSVPHRLATALKAADGD